MSRLKDPIVTSLESTTSTARRNKKCSNTLTTFSKRGSNGVLSCSRAAIIKVLIVNWCVWFNRPEGGAMLGTVAALVQYLFGTDPSRFRFVLPEEDRAKLRAKFVKDGYVHIEGLLNEASLFEDPFRSH